MIDDIALHGKIHFADVAISFAMPCVKELEDVMEGQALLGPTSNNCSQRLKAATPF